jgi:hypothetical protein
MLKENVSGNIMMKFRIRKSTYMLSWYRRHINELSSDRPIITTV